MIKKNFTLKGLQKLMLLALAFCCSIQIGFAQPANDLCAGATDLTPLLGGATNTLSFSTDGTTDSGVQNTNCSASGLDNFFSWTATTDQLSFTSLAPGNPGIAVYASCADAAAGNEIDCLTTFSTGDVNGWAIGDAIIVQIYDFAGSTSDVAFSLTATTAPLPAANDNCADAIALSTGIGACEAPVDGSDIGATASGELPLPACGGFTIGDEADVWFTATASSAGSLTIEMGPPSGGGNAFTDFALNAYTGACGALTSVGCDDDGGPGLYPRLALTGLAPNEVVQIRVYDFATNGETTFSICAFAPASFCDFVPALEVDGPASYDICEGEEVDLEVEVLGGGAAPDAFATLYFAFNDFATFNLLDAATPTVVAPLGGQALFAIDFAGGVLYGLDNDTDELITIDPATGAQTVIGAAGISAGQTWVGMSYNEADGVLYAASTDITVSTLYSIDVATGAATVIGTNNQAMIWLAINNDGDAFFLDLVDDNIYSIDLATAAATNVGPLGIGVNFAQGADFDPQTGLLIAATYSGGGSNSIVIVDTTTGAATDIGLSLPNGEAGGFALQGGVNNFTYSWTPATGLSCTTCPNPTANPTTTTTYTLTVTDGCGSVETYTTTVNVNFPTGLGNGDDITCIGNVNASVDVNCSLTITADEMVSGTLACPGLFGVDIDGTGSGTIQVGGSSPYQIGDVLDVEITYPDGSNACWGSITLEDKTAPTITCVDVTVECNDDTSVAALGQPVVDESCGGVTLTHVDATVNGDCLAGDDFLTQIFRTWTATNASGMSVTCTQVITVNRQSITSGIDAPANFDGFDQPTLSCSGVFATLPNGAPTTDVTGVPTIGGANVDVACGLTMTFSDEFVADVCEGTTKIFRTFTIIDHCEPSAGGGNRVDITQFIKIEDKTAPVIDCPSSVDVSTDFDACTATIIVPVPGLTDDCAAATSLTYTVTKTTAGGTLVALPSGGYVAQDLPLGKTTIMYRAEDPCGNVSFCTTDINVADEVSPAMSCETFRKVTLQNINANEPTLIFANAFDDGSFDACGIVSFEVRRMAGCIDFDWTTQGPGLDSDPNGFLNFRDRGTSAFYPAVPFSCCDIGTNVMVELRATDEAGNTNSCMVEVEVEDKANPIVSCPANVTIECLDEVPGYDFLSAVETATFNTQVFAGTPFNPGDFLGWYDGVVDNCGATLYISEGGSLNDCSVGTLTRRFQAQDANGNLSTPCTQRITVVNSDPFNITDTQCNQPGSTDDVQWPCDVTLNCGGDVSPTAANSPVLLRNDQCDIIAMNHSDFELPIVNNTECRKILRTWTITDHCQFEIDNATGTPTAGFWQYTQVIKVVDNEAPVLDCSPVAGSEDADPVTCDAEVALTIGSDSNNCEGEVLRYTWAIDAFNDGTIDFTGVGNDATDTYPTGEHRIIWSVEDYCGNVGDDCVQLFYVVDNTPPNIVALTQTDVNLANGLGEIWPSEVEVSSFDICSGIVSSLLVKPSLGDGQTAPPAGSANGDGASFTCDDLPAGASDAVIPVDYWLQDGAGNWSYVTIMVNVDDSQGFCTSPETATVAGSIMTEELETVGGVTVNVDGNSTEMPTAMVTTNDGAYSYALETMMNYSIEPVRDDNPTLGLTAYDLILMGQHLLEQVTLDSPYKLIAADVNNSGSITALDMIALRRVLLFIDTEFTNNTSWRFVETAYNFPNPANPFATTFPEVINYNNLTADQLDGDFVAVKIGDLNLSAPTNALAEAGDTRSNDGDLVFNVADQKLVAGNTYSVDVKANEFTNMLGYQFTLAFDQNVVEFEDFTAGALRGLTADNFGFAKLNEGALTTVWTNTNAVSVANDEVLFTLNFVAKKDGNLSDVISVDQVRFTPAEAYTNNGDLFDVAIDFGQVTDAGFSLAQNRPNPFRNETVIEFTLPEATTATLTIYDVAGRVLKTIKGDYSKGANMETINSSDLNATGVLYYQLDTPTQSATMKMIVIK